MTEPADVPIRPRHLRAPQGDGETLIEPKVQSALSVLQQNRKSLHRLEHNIGGHPLVEISEDARTQLVAAALRYTCAYRDHPLAHSSTSLRPNLILSGHQPELFHPGVWLKNFALGELARKPDCVAVNLIVDNDTAGSASIRIPAGSLLSPHWEEVGIDAPAPNIPFEERPVISSPAVRDFPLRLRNQFNAKDWFASNHFFAMVADEVWKRIELPSAGQSMFPLGETLSRARHRLEETAGLQTLELPLSQVAQTVPFRYLALHLMTDSGRLREIYNRSLIEYRTINRIRSESHPVPALIRDGDWFETPYWIWTTENPRRQRLFVQSRKYSNGRNILKLTDRGQLQCQFDWGLESMSNWTDQWDSLEARGIKIRPRALITTMYARLFLSDLFIHGIGGAKYDELTDAIIRRFFGIEPPAFMTVTGTVRLPIPRPSTTAGDVRNAKQLVREIRFHPERFVNDAAPAVRESAILLAAQKQELLRQHQFQFRRASRESFRALDDLNRQLNSLLVDVETRLRDDVNTCERETEQARVLGSREFSFVLHPADELPEQLKRMAVSA